MGATSPSDPDHPNECHSSGSSPAARLWNVSKTYFDAAGAPHVALDGIELEIHENEFFTLLGPSGCGKTTLLRLIGGFEQPTKGGISIFDQEMAGQPPEQRPVNTVFQHYALFPHLNVRRNIGFSLEMLGRDRVEISDVTNRMLGLVGLDAMADRMPDQLSGGQRQRVALARALAPQPKILLLDEPLSALDLKLRQKMRLELKALQRETGITFVFVTHDQEEALAMSDRIAVLADGRVQQLGTPEEIYDAPANRFVADFIGGSNLLEARVSATGRVSVSGLGELDAETGQAACGNAVTLCVRPEQLVLSPSGAGGIGPFQVVDRTYLGNAVAFHLKAEGQLVTAHMPRGGARGQLDFQPGDQVYADFEPGALQVLAQ